MSKLLGHVIPVSGGQYEHDFCKMSLAKRYNEETKLVGKKVRVKKVKSTEFFMGC